MRKQCLLFAVCITLVLVGCKNSWLGEQERRDLETAINFGFIKASVEHSATLDALIEAGEIEKAQKIIRMGIFLDLQQLGRLTDEDYRAVMGKAFVPMAPVLLEKEVISLQRKYYVEGVKAAEEQYVDIPSDIRPIREG